VVVAARVNVMIAAADHKRICCDEMGAADEEVQDHIFF